MVSHPIAPVWDTESKILILGSFPSVKSREQGFFYGHPRNRFWRVLAAVFEDVEPHTVEEKEHFLHRHHIALWDVIASCEISGSADSTIKNVRPNDLSTILSSAPIGRIFVNGKTAKAYYDRYLKAKIGMDAFCLPSTSPANASWSLERLIQEWKLDLLMSPESN